MCSDDFSACGHGEGANHTFSLTDSLCYIFVFQPLGQFSNFDFTTCGVDKGCLGYPAGCGFYDDCQVMVSWRQDPVNTDQVAIELVSDKTDGFVALGWSRDIAMVRSQTVICQF